MTSKSGGYGERNRGPRGHGKALDDSQPKPSTDEKAQDGAGRRADFENSMVKPKVSNIFFKPTSNGGRGGQQGKAGAEGTSLLKELQVKKVDTCDTSVVENSMEKPKESEFSFKPASSGGPKDLKVEEEAEKLALLSSKSSKKSADQMFQKSLEKAKLCETPSQTTSSGGLREVADQNNNGGGIENSLENRGGPFTPISEHKFAEVEKVAEKLALLDNSCPKTSEKFANKYSLEKENFSANSPKMTSCGGRGKVTSLLKSLHVKCIADKLAKSVADENNNCGIVNNLDIHGMNDQNGANGKSFTKNSFKEAKKGCEGLVSKDERQPNLSGGEAKRGREGLFCQNERQSNRAEGAEKIHENRSNLSDGHEKFREGYDESFWENVKLFQKAFGDDHYLVKASREGRFNKDDLSASSSSGGSLNLLARNCRDEDQSPFVDSTSEAPDENTPGGENQSQDLDQI